jgi:hypothetical protein
VFGTAELVTGTAVVVITFVGKMDETPVLEEAELAELLELLALFMRDVLETFEARKRSSNNK